MPRPKLVSIPAGHAAAATLAVAAAGAVEPRGIGPRTEIGVRGAGPVKVGMTIREAEGATGQDLVPIGDGEPGSECRSVRVKDYPGLSFMLNGRRIGRVDINVVRNPTTRGIRRGDSEAAVERAHRGRIRVEPNFYDRSGRYLVFTPASRAPRNRRIVFETDCRRVTDIRAGRCPKVRYVEGCS